MMETITAWVLNIWLVFWVPATAAAFASLGDRDGLWPEVAFTWVTAAGLVAFGVLLLVNVFLMLLSVFQ